MQRPTLLSLLFLAGALSLSSNSLAQPQIQDGDIIFQTSLSSQSQAVQQATDSPYSHMGIIFIRNNKPYVYEASATVRYTPLQQWIDRGRNSHYVIKRLKQDELLTPEAIERLRLAAQRWEGRPYDTQFRWSNERMYCSELVWKVYEGALELSVGGVVIMDFLHMEIPEVRYRLRERFGNDINKIPRSEPVISPADIFKSPLLHTVAESANP